MNLQSTYVVISRQLTADAIEVTDTIEPTTMLFVTPGEGTQNRDTPDGRDV